MLQANLFDHVYYCPDCGEELLEAQAGGWYYCPCCDMGEIAMLPLYELIAPMASLRAHAVTLRTLGDEQTSQDTRARLYFLAEAAEDVAAEMRRLRQELGALPW